jgi:hypothetical protein
MTGKPQLIVMPSSDSSIELKAVTERNDQVLPRLGLRTFNHSYELVVVDLAGDPVHTIVIRQNGDVEVDA